MQFLKISDEDLNIHINAINNLSSIAGVRFSDIQPIMNHLTKVLVPISEEQDLDQLKVEEVKTEKVDESADFGS